MQARYQATLQPEQMKGHKAGCPARKQVLFQVFSRPPQNHLILRNCAAQEKCLQPPSGIFRVLVFLSYSTPF
jgi:hypothetical protein